MRTARGMDSLVCIDSRFTIHTLYSLATFTYSDFTKAMITSFQFAKLWHVPQYHYPFSDGRFNFVNSIRKKSDNFCPFIRFQSAILVCFCQALSFVPTFTLVIAEMLQLLKTISVVHWQLVSVIKVSFSQAWNRKEKNQGNLDCWKHLTRRCQS